ncbi:MAG: VWA domain-containing protein [Desulfobacula sp.]|uniref:VWA domain-containing protein n=1 Tax=Desulfobacula sp. TaxID=2593537 RepID=UPI0025BD2559|nr:VWA domain-containing protein [Desulfobacula sp.]MCD4719151.1 VWA domain-containing protein [Desulfobacula sp.]
MSSPHLMTRQQDAGVMLQGDTEDMMDVFATGWFHDQHREDLGEKSFFSFTQKEMEEMQEVIELLVRKLKDTIKRRHAKTKRGIPDIKKILRTASRYQGIPMQLVFRGKPKQRGEIVTLCDVSGSVWTAAKFMLSMLYSLQDCFLAVRSFIFVSELAEVTRTFERYEVKKAIDKALVEAKIDYKGTTNYGKAFRYFKTQYLDILNKKTTLIIIGDSRTNYTNSEAEILKEMQDKCQRVIWLNPEPRVLWNTGDSRMRAYETYCRQVQHCENLNQLLAFIKHLVL